MIEIDLIKKHGKRIFGMQEHGHHTQTWRQRLPEILLEIGIIVFAVSLSIQLHAWHEHSLDREAERKFLFGLRADLTKDLAEMSKDSARYAFLTKYVLDAQIEFSSNSKTKASAINDLTPRRKPTLSFSLRFAPNISRFEALKSSGRISIIEDDELANEIASLYEEQVPALVRGTDRLQSFVQDKIGSYINEHFDASKNNEDEVWRSPIMLNYLVDSRMHDAE